MLLQRRLEAFYYAVSDPKLVRFAGTFRVGCSGEQGIPFSLSRSLLACAGLIISAESRGGQIDGIRGLLTETSSDHLWRGSHRSNCQKCITMTCQDWVLLLTCSTLDAEKRQGR